jgi:hypothetical protein
MLVVDGSLGMKALRMAGCRPFGGHHVASGNAFATRLAPRLDKGVHIAACCDASASVAIPKFAKF